LSNNKIYYINHIILYDICCTPNKIQRIYVFESIRERERPEQKQKFNLHLLWPVNTSVFTVSIYNLNRVIRLNGNTYFQRRFVFMIKKKRIFHCTIFEVFIS